jgi:hypothetical protein
MKIPDLFSLSRTLFLPAPGQRGMLVTHARGRMRKKVMKFPDAQAALAWCEEHGAGFVYWPVQTVQRN